MLIHGCLIIENLSAHSDRSCGMKRMCMVKAVLYRPCSIHIPITLTYVTCIHALKHVYFNELMQEYRCIIHPALHSLLSFPIHPSASFPSVCVYVFPSTFLPFSPCPFDRPNIRCLMCTCVHQRVYGQQCIASIKLPQLGRERQILSWLWLMASDNITASYLYFLTSHI